MANTRRHAVAAMATVATLTGVPGIRAAQPRTTSPMVVITVEDDAQVPAETLVYAERRASRIYASAGIQIVWMNSPANPDVPNSARHLYVLLLTRDMAQSRADAAQFSDRVMGAAMHASGRAVVFYFRINDLALGGRCYRSDMLAKVLTHEVGHLLLPQPGHSVRGIMRAHLDLRPGHGEFFTGVQARAMRRALTSGPTAD